MGKVLPTATGYTGTVGNMIMYKSKGQLICRSKPTKYTNRNTPKQKDAWSRFDKLNRLSRISLDDINKKIWTLGDPQRTTQQLFTHINSPALDKEGNIEFYDRLHFSIGQLNLPNDMKFSLPDPASNTILLEWDNYNTKLPTNPTDRLRIIAIHNEELEIIHRLTAFLKDKSSTFTVPWENWKRLHLYAYFYDEYYFTSTPTYYQNLSGH